MESGQHPNFTAGTVTLIPVRIKDRKEAVVNNKEARDKIRQLLSESNFFQDALFFLVTFIYRYGELNKFEIPESGRINKKHGDLPVTVEISSNWI
jgi:hypothetical protein